MLTKKFILEKEQRRMEREERYKQSGKVTPPNLLEQAYQQRFSEDKSALVL